LDIDLDEIEDQEAYYWNLGFWELVECKNKGHYDYDYEEDNIDVDVDVDYNMVVTVVDNI